MQCGEWRNGMVRTGEPGKLVVVAKATGCGDGIEMVSVSAPFRQWSFLANRRSQGDERQGMCGVRKWSSTRQLSALSTASPVENSTVSGTDDRFLRASCTGLAALGAYERPFQG